jgi:hypothetical protein
MANPNINTCANCYFDNAQVQLTTTNATLLLSNAASSNEMLVIDSIVVANVDGVNACDVTLQRFPNATNTGTPTRIGRTITVPANSSIIITGSENGANLKENQSIYVTASAANRLEVDCNFRRYS